MRIVLDTMGGDKAPDEVVKGGMAAARDLGVQVVLVGPQPEIERILGGSSLPGLHIVHAPEVIGTDESPVQALRRKPKSSLAVGFGLLRDGQADALVSAGNTGALMAGALLALGSVEGMRRPALCADVPVLSGGHVTILDVGANVDARPEDLYQYAVAGDLYRRHLDPNRVPRVGLLNIGGEAAKGNELTRAAYPMLQQGPFHFVGNIEARDVPQGPADVLVCDGFVGNIVLKLYEGLGLGLFRLLRQELSANWRGRVGGLIARPVFRSLARRVDYEEVGGAPLFGPRGAVIKCHGASGARSITNGIAVARNFVAQGFVAELEAHLKG